ncbi:MAG: lipocalin family protein [Porphyrobacter sp.]|nr:lipocalin family protein [Porphyrobacter sp.]
MRTRHQVLAGVAIAATGAALFTTTRTIGRHPRGNAKVPEPAKPVDLQRYLGLWYEIARYDQRFERGCISATAEYTLRDDGRISVVNIGRKRDGTSKTAHGVAKVVDTSTNAKLKVRFFGPFGGDYWVLDHADDYGWSIVGEPSGRYLWILARDPNLDSAQVKELTKRAAGLGYDTSMLFFDKH